MKFYGTSEFDFCWSYFHEWKKERKTSKVRYHLCQIHQSWMDMLYKQRELFRLVKGHSLQKQRSGKVNTVLQQFACCAMSRVSVSPMTSYNWNLWIDHSSPAEQLTQLSQVCLFVLLCVAFWLIHTWICQHNRGPGNSLQQIHQRKLKVDEQRQRTSAPTRQWYRKLIKMIKELGSLL